jgi:Flp pilus assembly protein TadD
MSAQTTFAGGQYTTSLAHYSEMIQLDPDDPEAYRGRGIVHLREGNHAGKSRYTSVRRQRCFDKAIMDFTSAIGLAPKDAGLYLWRGIAFKAKGHLDEAIADFTEAIRLAPKDSRAFVERSGAHERKGEIDEAKADSAKADQLAESLW